MSASVAKTANKPVHSATGKANAKGSAKPASAKTATKSTLGEIPAKTAVKSVTAKKTVPAVRKSASAKAAAQKPVKSTVIAKTPGTQKRPAVNNMAKSIAPAPAKLAAASGKPVKPAARKSSKHASDGLSEPIEAAVVSKVREVATKTSKSTTAIPADGTLLTEEQILKMSEKDYMNKAQLDFFKARLQQLERDLRKNADETTEHLRETVLVPDPADRATIEEEHALELRTRDRERKLLKKVQQSLASIESGDYGWCEETGDPIGIPRLLARPTATLSLEAQQRRELKQKLYGD